MSRKPTLKSIEEGLKGLEFKEALERLKSLECKYEMSLARLIEKYEKRFMAHEMERSRYRDMCKYERQYYLKGIKMIAGIDEAGRGPLAGPVVAASVILPENVFINKLNDSKKLTPAVRNELFDIIRETAISYGIGIVDEKEIDEVNILNATKHAMVSAVQSMDTEPEMLLIDAVELENIGLKQLSITKGDTLSVSIAAASILAKVTRDRIIEEIDSIYPQYGFCRHKGYGTEEHIEAIKKYGICPIHRVSFTKKITR